METLERIAIESRGSFTKPGRMTGQCEREDLAVQRLVIPGGEGGTSASQAEWLHVHAWKAPDENEDLISSERGECGVHCSLVLPG